MYKISASGGTLPRRVRDGDPHGRRLRHGGSVALGGSAALVQYSPARRTYFVRNDRVAGTRPSVSGYGLGLFGMEGRGFEALKYYLKNERVTLFGLLSLIVKFPKWDYFYVGKDK